MYVRINDDIKLLNEETFKKLYNNLNEIKLLAEAKGYAISPLEPIGSLEIPNLLAAFNNFEKNIQIIHNALNLQELFYKSYEWFGYSRNFAEEIHRWIKWQNNLYDTLTKA